MYKRQVFLNLTKKHDESIAIDSLHTSIVSTFGGHYPDPESPASWAGLERLAPHMQFFLFLLNQSTTVYSQLDQLCNVFGLYAGARGQFLKAYRFLCSGRKYALRVFGQDSLKYAERLRDVGHRLSLLGKTTRSLTYYRLAEKGIAHRNDSKSNFFRGNLEVTIANLEFENCRPEVAVNHSAKAVSYTHLTLPTILLV